MEEKNGQIHGGRAFIKAIVLSLVIFLLISAAVVTLSWDLKNRDSRMAPEVVLYGGLISALLLALLIYFLLTRKNEAVFLAAKMTADIENKNRDIKRVNRALKTISEADQMTIRSGKEEELLKEACKILVESGGYRLVWIGNQEGADKPVFKSMAWGGYNEGYIERAIALAEKEIIPYPFSAAFKEKRTIIIPDLEKDENFKTWIKEAVQRGYKSTIAIPILAGETILGTIAIYSSELDAFNQEEIDLLEGLSKSLSFGLTSIRDRAEKEAVRLALKKTADEMFQFKLAVDSASDHIVITDPKGTIIYANKGVEQMTGYSQNEIIGQNPRLWGGQMSKEFYEKMWRTVSVEKKPFVGDIRNKRKNGEVYETKSSISPILDEKDNVIYYVGVERDITAEKEIDRSKSEFISLASHQLRTPISAINWYSEMLLDGDAGELVPKQKEYTEYIYASSRRMAELVGALLDVSRIELATFAVEPKPTNVAEIASSCIQELQAKIDARHQFVEQKYLSDLPLVNVDQNLTRIIFQNLISNSVKYTPDGGKISVSIKRVDDFLEIAVADTGYGIPAGQKNRIFSKFFRADNIIPIETDGTGLGLYLVKELLGKVGGQIRFESEENKGSIFYVTIPLSGMLPRPGSGGGVPYFNLRKN